MNKAAIVWVVVTLVVLLILKAVFLNVERIDAGNVGVKVNLTGSGRGVDGVTYVTGWVPYCPLFTAVYEFPVYVQHKDYPEFSVTAKGGTNFGVSPKLNYQVVESKVPDIFATYRVPLNKIEDQFLLTSIQKAYQETANGYTPDSLISSKVSFDKAVEDKFKMMVSTQGFDIKQLTSTLEVPASLKQAIDAKNIQQQTNLRAQALKTQAEAEAQVAIAQANGEAQALKINADAQAYANQKQQTTLTPLLVEKMRVEKWNGAYPTTVTGGGTLLNIK